MRLALLALAALLLAACGEEEPNFTASLSELTKDLRGKVDPLPRMRPPPDPAYRAGALPDPFYPEKKAR